MKRPVFCSAHRWLIIIPLLGIILQTYAQDVKYGKIDKSELTEQLYPWDTSASAAIIYKSRHSYFDYLPEKGFVIIEKYHYRIKIYKREGLDYATHKIKLYHNKTMKEEIVGLKGITYNLVKGKITKSKLNKDAVFREKSTKYYDTYKFTMPSVHPGSVIEFKYTLQSPFYTLFNEVILQEEIPIKYVEVDIDIPEYFHYRKKIKGFLPVHIAESTRPRTITFTAHERVNEIGGYRMVTTKGDITFNEKRYHIVKQNVPALKREPYCGNLDNYKTGIIFELAYVQFPGASLETFASDWDDIIKRMLEDPDFGEQLTKTRHFKDDLPRILSGKTKPEEKMNAVFTFIKKKIKWNGTFSKYASGNIAKSYREGKGTSGDVNLNLIAMLKAAGLDTDPVIISTIDNGIPLFPTIHGFDHVIARVTTDEGTFLLDATEKYSLPNVLPERDLNFKGLVIKPSPVAEWVELHPTKPSIIKYVVQANFNGEDFEGTARKMLSGNYLLNYRNRFHGNSPEEIKKALEKDYGVEIMNLRTTHLNDVTEKATEAIQFRTDEFYDEITGKIYIQPLLYLQLKENPFKSTERKFPVFFNYPRVISKTVQIRLPDDYEIESLPENKEFSMSDNSASYKLEYSKTPLGVMIKSVLKINAPIISPGKYGELKTLYDKRIKAEKQRIILKKKPG